MRGKYKTKFSGGNFKKLKKYIKKLKNGKSTTDRQKCTRTTNK
mgnify:CR=1 FL=1